MPRATAYPVAILVACLAIPAPALAQDEAPSVAEMRARIEGCLAPSLVRETDETCIGAASTVCMNRPEGQTTRGMSACLGAETEAWDAILNAMWPRVKAAAEQADAIESPQEMGLPSRAQALLDAQRAWIAFRDAECLHAYAMGGSGTIRTLYGASCQLEQTAGRVLDFRQWLRAPP
ncbi:DUF1311 domain-containing protein [Albimonas sp. CAU 1670]|uniref:lysozyme inhibitor LprI family protein n=1 Tax=Albimonas sp. CAU 1670 TaxID=3032599 RepID=UPI0023DA98ED|nr:lysozyme inhibitor LprI family protein [Albimonas sp. CAU 1670]MDF2231134.1 DUF1311 domain-containing protein [Albimonas sp. CAU 1670]